MPTGRHDLEYDSGRGQTTLRAPTKRNPGEVVNKKMTVWMVAMLLAATQASADLYVKVLEDGRKTYANFPCKDCQKLDLDPKPITEATPPSKPGARARTPQKKDRTDDGKPKISTAERVDHNMPANSEPDKHANQGWACKVGFTQAVGKCWPMPPEIVKKMEAEKRESAKLLASERKKELAERREKGVQVGMSQVEVRQSSWGRPNSVNRTSTSRGTHEQWVYGGHNYLYFEDGILTSIQN